MKPFEEQDHYEVLELPRNATRDDVERAYRLARETYADESLAGYSVLTGAESGVLRERMEAAYRVLSDEAARQVYDAARRKPEPASWDDAPEAVAAAAAEPAAQPVQEPFDALDEEGPDWDGARLRRCRLRRGMDPEDVAKVTKVHPTYLQFIEEERFHELPARVYVRGFVMAFAGCLGLDASAVAGSYLKRYEAGRRDKRRGRPW